MKKIYLCLVALVLSVFFINLASAKFLNINELNQKYSIGDNVNLQVELTNTGTISKNLTLEENLIYPRSGIVPRPYFNVFELKAGEKAISNELAFTVLENAYAGKYSYCANVYENIDLLETLCKNFSIAGTLSMFEKISIGLLPPRAAFLLNESPIVVIVQDYENAILNGTLISPDGTISKIPFIGGYAAIDFSKIGSYKFKIEASREGYKTFSKEIEFTVIGKPAEIIKETICNNDNICNPAENYGNCPADCKSGSADGYCDSIKDNKCDSDCVSKNDNDCKGKLTYIIFVLVAAAIIAAAFLILRKKRA